MPLITEDWTRRVYNQSPDGRWTAVLEFLVASAFPGDVVNELVALSLAPRQGSSHPFNAFLLATDPKARREGFNLWRVAVGYQIIPAILGSLDGNPLNAPTRIRYEHGEQSYPVDHDFNGNPIVNSAGDGFSSNFNDTMPTRFFTFISNRRGYYLSDSIAYEDMTNSSDWTVQGVTFGAGTCKCLTLGPEGEWTGNAQYVPIAYRFEFNPKGFKLRVLDQGRRAYYQPIDANGGEDPVLAGIVDSANEATTVDVLLDGNGGLAKSAVTAGFTVAGNESADGGATPAGATVDSTNAAAAGTTWFLWTVKGSADFNALGL